MSSYQTTDVGYTPTAKALHWLVVALLAVQYIVAWNMPHIGRNTVPDTIINLHFSLGVLIVAVIIVRLGWRLTHPEPTPLAGLPPWQAYTARALHWVLYALLIVIPVLGWMNASFRGYEVRFFGLFAMPKLVGTRAPGFGWTGDVHMLVSYYALLPLIGVHVAAALYHRLVRRDSVLARMLPNGGG
jgi:cytochrome b561